MVRTVKNGIETYLIYSDRRHDRIEKIENAKNNVIRLTQEQIDSSASKKDSSRPAFVIDVVYKN